jgi:hypothetical protein
MFFYKAQKRRKHQNEIRQKIKQFFSFAKCFISRTQTYTNFFTENFRFSFFLLVCDEFLIIL